jgi:hypothetical protein
LVAPVLVETFIECLEKMSIEQISLQTQA